MVRSSKANSDKDYLTRIFSGKKAKWLPLYRRLIARLAKIPGIEIVPNTSTMSIAQPGDELPTVGLIKVSVQGIEVGLALSKAAVKSPRLRDSAKSSPRSITHRVLICEAAEIDEELCGWVRAAHLRARIAKKKAS